MAKLSVHFDDDDQLIQKNDRKLGVIPFDKFGKVANYIPIKSKRLFAQSYIKQAKLVFADISARLTNVM